MLAKQLLREQVYTLTKEKITNERRLDLWRSVRGLWRKKRLDPVKYQRRLRDEADHVKI